MISLISAVSCLSVGYEVSSALRLSHRTSALVHGYRVWTFAPNPARSRLARVGLGPWPKALGAPDTLDGRCEVGLAPKDCVDGAEANFGVEDPELAEAMAGLVPVEDLSAPGARSIAALFRRGCLYEPSARPDQLKAYYARCTETLDRSHHAHPPLRLLILLLTLTLHLPCVLRRWTDIRSRGVSQG